MAELTTPAAAGLIASGAGATMLSALGLEPGPLFWAFVGATLGITAAAATTRVRAGVIFVGVVLSCSLFGSWLAQRYMGGEQLSRNAFACVLAMFFHPLVSLALTKLPALWDAVVNRMVGPTGAEKP